MKMLKKLFKQKGNPFAQNGYSYFQAPGKPVWMPREYNKFAQEAYIKNVIAYRAINLIAQGAASVPWLLYERKGDDKIEIKNHPVLRLLKRPSPLCSGSEFLQNLYIHRMISGNAYVLSAGLDSSPPQELYLLRPDRVTVIAGKNTIPQGYRYTVGENYRDYMVDKLTGRARVLHLKNFHPLDDWYGLSAIEAAAYSIDQHNHAAMWNQSLLQHGARPSGALVVKSTDNSSSTLGEDQYRRLRQQIDDYYSGFNNAGRPIILEGGLDWKEMSLSPKDLDFIQSKHSNARDIALAFGVPPQLLGIPGDNTYSNLVEARLALWEQTILPLIDNVTTALNHWLVPMYRGELVLDYDTDEISALIPRRDALWNRLNNINFMTSNEKRQAVGLDPLKETRNQKPEI